MLNIRTKRVSDPFDDKAKARIRQCSSGSDNEGDPLFSGRPIHAFLQINESPSSTVHFSNGEEDDDCVLRNDHKSRDEETIRDLLDRWKKLDQPFLFRLNSDVIVIEKALQGLRPNRYAYRRAVVLRLRDSGYNAGICEAKWESSGSLIAGRYEYVDVIVNEKQRYIVDVEFATEFEVARATEEYTKLLASLPRTMVGRVEVVRQVVSIMEAAARMSLRSKELTVPPWRKRRYMLAKWLGPYQSTVNLLTSSLSEEAGEKIITCRAIGFWGSMIPPDTRIR